MDKKLNYNNLIQITIKKIKQLFFCSVFALLSVSIAFGQNETPNLPIDSSSGKITYSEVVMLKDSISKDELFSRAKISLAYLFKDSKSVIQNEDKESGIIIGKGTMSVIYRSAGTVFDAGYIHYTLTIAMKQSKYKYVITDFYHDGTGSKLPSGGAMENPKPKMWYQKQWDNAKSKMDSDIRNLIEALKTKMNNPTPKNDNW